MRKVILTEQQFNEGLMRNLLGSKITKDVIRKCLSAGIALTALISAIKFGQNYTPEQKQELIQYAQAMSQQDTAKIEAVRQYMEYALNNKGYNINSLKLTPEHIVKIAGKHNYDLALLMAQAHLESCFGMTPRAQRTNSVFSIGSYDDGRNLVQYNTQDDSVESYIRIMNQNYLSGGRTVEDLLKPGGFVNTQGQRYASDKKYEAKVNTVRNRIISMFPIIGQ